MTNEELAINAQMGDISARNTLWTAIQPLCCKLARRYFPLCERAGIERQDLEQELFFGYLAALNAFDPNKGYQFTTYLQYHIRNICATALHIRNGKRLNPLISLQSPLESDAENGVLQDLIEDKTSVYPFEAVEDTLYQTQLRKALEDCLQTLNAQQQEVIRLRFFEGFTLAETGTRLQCGAERVRQISDAALRRLRFPQNTRKLAQFREDIIQTESYHGTGYGAWKRNGSVQERTLVYLEDKGLL